MNQPHSLKLLHRLKGGDTIEIEVAGFPSQLYDVSGRLHFVRFTGTEVVRMEPEPLEIAIAPDGTGTPGQRFLGVIPDHLPVGMYLLSGITLAGREELGLVVMGSLGTTLAPLMPRLGFCIDHDVCDTKRTDGVYEFVQLRLL